MKKAEYKNAIETKRKISFAYLKLLKDNPKDVSISKIVKVASVTRGTFYLHFKNINDLEVHIQNNLSEDFKCIETAFRQFDLDEFPDKVVLKINELLKKNIEYYRLVASVFKNNYVVEQVKESIFKSVSNNFNLMKYITDMNRFKSVVEYLSAGLMSVYSKWLKNEISMSLDDLAPLLSSLIKNGVKGSVRVL